MSSYIERLEELLAYKDLSARAFEKKCGLSNGSIRKVKSPSGEMIGKVQAAFPDVNVKWLFYGTAGESMLIEERVEKKVNGVPVYDVDFNAGFIERFSETSIDTVGYLDTPAYSKATAVVSVTGDSMHPLISSGDQIILREMERTIDSIMYGNIYAVITDNDLRTVKRIRKSDKPGYIDLEPVNKEVADTTTIAFDRIISIWLVMGCIKPLM